MRTTIAVLLALPTLLFGQGEVKHPASTNRAVVGCVVDSAAGTPLDAAIVRVAHSRLVTQTDGVGFARIPIHAEFDGITLVERRVDTIVVERVGYVSRAMPVTAGTDSLLRLGVIWLVPVSDRYLRNEHGDVWDLVDLRQRQIARVTKQRDVCPNRLRRL
jgi:hypothetical protein